MIAPGSPASERAQRLVAEVAPPLGLAWDGATAHGVVAGRALALEVVAATPAAPGSLRLRAPLARALDLGLKVSARGFAGAVEEEDPFEAAFVLGGDEPGRVRDLLDEPLREAVLALAPCAASFVVADAGVTLGWPLEALPDADALLAARDAALAVNSHLERAAAPLRGSVRLRGHLDALGALARTHGLALAATPITLAGTLDGVAVRVASARVGWHAHRVAVEARFAAPLGLGVVLERAALRDTLPGAGGDVVLGLPALDRRFRVHRTGAAAEALPRLAALLDGAAGAELTALDADLGALRLDDAGLDVSALAIEVRPAALAAGVARLAALASLLAARAASLPAR